MKGTLLTPNTLLEKLPFPLMWRRLLIPTSIFSFFSPRNTRRSRREKNKTFVPWLINLRPSVFICGFTEYLLTPVSSTFATIGLGLNKWYFILPQMNISCHKCKTFYFRLGDKHPIKWISMVCRKLSDAMCMFNSDIQSYKGLSI
jgi:hypothetical protein